MSELKVIEKEFKILEVGKKNKNHRTYPFSVVNSWLEMEKNNENNLFELEYAIDEIDENGEVIERDVLNEFIVSSLSCGVVSNLRIDDNVLYATVKFKLPEYCNNLTEEIYKNDSVLDAYSVVPKGKGSVKSQTVQDDYELYGFNLILKEDSAFEYDEEEENVAVN